MYTGRGPAPPAAAPSVAAKGQAPLPYAGLPRFWAQITTTMPTYEYRCPGCGNEFEKFQKMSDEPVAECPACGAASERRLSGGAGLLFKGSGFYITDYRGEGYKKAAAAEKGGGSSSSETKSSDAKPAESKPAKAEAKPEKKSGPTKAD